MSDGGMRLGVLISGSGTNLQAILDACDDGSLTATVAVVISSHDSAVGLERARRAGIPAVWIDRTEYDRASKYNEALRDTLLQHGVGMVVMAGYMRLLGQQVLETFPDRVVNLHPALLPAFPGANGIRDAFEHGVKVTGVTVHFANENFDDGPIIAQEPVIIDEDDTLDTLEAKIHDVEHRLYPAALQLLAMRRVEIDGRRTHILPPIPVISE